MNWKKIFVEAIAGFIGWTSLLTPYMVFVVRVTFRQYLSWILMQIILVPFIAPVDYQVAICTPKGSIFILGKENKKELKK